MVQRFFSRFIEPMQARRSSSLRHLYGPSTILYDSLMAIFLQCCRYSCGMEAHMDLVYIGLTLAFFAVSALLVYGLEKLGRPR
ncbi:MAG: hypothetical protein ACXWCX_02350 [Burkholderiales bacterium]